MQKLHELAINSRYREFLKIEEGTHNDTFDVGGVRYYRHINFFLTNVFGASEDEKL